MLSHMPLLDSHLHRCRCKDLLNCYASIHCNSGGCINFARLAVVLLPCSWPGAVRAFHWDRRGQLLQVNTYLFCHEEFSQGESKGDSGRLIVRDAKEIKGSRCAVSCGML